MPLKPRTDAEPSRSEAKRIVMGATAVNQNENIQSGSLRTFGDCGHNIDSQDVPSLTRRGAQKYRRASFFVFSLPLNREVWRRCWSDGQKDRFLLNRERSKFSLGSGPTGKQYP